MERPHARFRASQEFQTEHNLARQPIPPEETEVVPAETNIVEMPDRPPLSDRSLNRPSDKSAATTARSNRKDTPRKPRTPAAKRKLVVSFRRLWESNQQVFTEEVQQLEAYVDRINQILAERSRQSSLEQPRSNASTESEQPEAADPNSTPPLSASTRSRRAPQLPQFTSMVEQESNRSLEQQDTENLQAEVDQITHLLNEVDSWVTAKPSIPQNSPNTARSPFQAPSSQPGLESAAPDATRTAEALRHLANRERATLPNELGESNPHAQRLTRLTRKRSRRRRGFRLNLLLQLPKTPIDKVGDAVLWIVLAGVARIGIEFLLATVPTLSPLVMGLMVAPAAIAVYLTIFVPDAGFVPVYRLFLVMLGLLLGGKL